MPSFGRESVGLSACCVVAKRQRVWLRGNASEDWVLGLAESLDANSSCGNVGNVDVRTMCAMSVTPVAKMPPRTQ
jgi:hypothetical protein